MAAKLWDGRFRESTDQVTEKFTSSIAFDRRLYSYDIDGSIAHCRMLAKTAIISEAEAETLVGGLEAIRADIEQGDFEYDDRLEDIHMHIEAALSVKVGNVARKLHTARSRNDQIALDIRMYLRAESGMIIAGLKDLRREIVALAKANPDAPMPGYTHTQRAQPVLLAHHLLAYNEMFARDGQRFADGLKRIDAMPLGCAALAGTTFPIDRHYTADLLGFSNVSANSMDAVSDRDFVAEFLASASICMVHFSRLSEELILWSTSEFAFVELPDAFTTGSSIMPQKKNPDVCELTRGKAGRVFGDLIAILTLMKSLPLSYNRDMQEDKEPLFDAVDTVRACIEIHTHMLPKLKFNKETMLAATSKGFLNATDMADYLVTKGMPFREAHGCVGKAVAWSVENNRELHELSLGELKSFSSLVENDIYDVLSTESMIDRRTSYGGTASENVRNALVAAEKALDEHP